MDFLSRFKLYWSDTRLDYSRDLRVDSQISVQVLFWRFYYLFTLCKHKHTHKKAENAKKHERRKDGFSHPCQVDLKLAGDFRVGTGNSVHVLLWGFYYLITFCKCNQTKHSMGFFGCMKSECSETWWISLTRLCIWPYSMPLFGSPSLQWATRSGCKVIFF